MGCEAGQTDKYGQTDTDIPPSTSIRNQGAVRVEDSRLEIYNNLRPKEKEP